MTVKLGQQEAVQVSLKIREDSKPKRPHQAFLVLRDPVTDLQVPFALTVNPSGEGKVQFVSQVDMSSLQQLADERDVGSERFARAIVDGKLSPRGETGPGLFWLCRGLGEARLQDGD